MGENLEEKTNYNPNIRKEYSYKEALEASKDYFNGDELAADTF